MVVALDPSNGEEEWRCVCLQRRELITVSTVWNLAQ